MKISKNNKQQIIHLLSGKIQGKWELLQDYDKYTTIDGGICKLYNTGTCQFQGKKEPKEQLESIVFKIIGIHPLETESKEHQIFIVYGHDTTSIEQLELILQKLELKHDKMINDSGMTIIDALEKRIKEIHCGIVLLTDDDLAISKSDYEDNKEKPLNPLLKKRARQNVILELGMLISKLGRNNIIILKKENVELPSDIGGIFYIEFNKHIRETVKKMAIRLQAIGFNINTDNLLKSME